MLLAVYRVHRHISHPSKARISLGLFNSARGVTQFRRLFSSDSLSPFGLRPGLDMSGLKHAREKADPRLSASVILLNEKHDVLMIQRVKDSRTFSGMHVRLYRIQFTRLSSRGERKTLLTSFDSLPF